MHAGHGSNHTLGADGVLYKCTATNTWSVYYTPYDYPHPLRSGDPATATFFPRVLPQRMK